VSPDIATSKSPTGTAAIAARMAPMVDTVRTRVLPRFIPLFQYLTRTETHTYAFSVAANAILAFFPFVLLMLTVSRRFFHSWGLDTLLLQVLHDNLPAAQTGQDLVVRSLNAMVGTKAVVTLWSIIVLLFTSTGVFLPLEVALNEVWGVKKSRSYLMNQVVSFGLTFLIGLLAMVSVALTGAGQSLTRFFLFPIAHLGFVENVLRVVVYLMFQVIAVIASITIFFLVYWLLPNCKVPYRSVLPSAIATGVLWEAAKYIYVIALPHLDFRESYGPFSTSVTLIMWAFISGLIMLAGARSCVLGRADEPAS